MLFRSNNDGQSRQTGQGKEKTEEGPQEEVGFSIVAGVMEHFSYHFSVIKPGRIRTLMAIPVIVSAAVLAACFAVLLQLHKALFRE